MKKKKSLTFKVGGYYSGNKPMSVGYGFICSDGHKASGTIRKYQEQRNVAGELNAVMHAIKYAVNQGVKKVVINIKFVGAEHFVTGKWRAKSECARIYAAWMNNQIEKHDLNVKFKHVGAKGTQAAVNLARKAVFGSSSSWKKKAIAKYRRMRRRDSDEFNDYIEHEHGGYEHEEFPIPESGSDVYKKPEDRNSNITEDLPPFEPDNTIPTSEVKTDTDNQEGTKRDVKLDKTNPNRVTFRDATYSTTSKYGFEFMMRPFVSYKYNIKQAAESLSPIALTKIGFSLGEELHKSKTARVQYSAKLSILVNLFVAYITESWVIVPLRTGDYRSTDGMFYKVFCYDDVRWMVDRLREREYIEVVDGFYKSDGSGRITIIRPTKKFLREVVVGPDLDVFDAAAFSRKIDINKNRQVILNLLQKYLFRIEAWRCYDSAIPLTLKKKCVLRKKGKRIVYTKALSNTHVNLAFKLGGHKHVKEQVRMLQEINQYYKEKNIPVSIKGYTGMRLYGSYVRKMQKHAEQDKMRVAKKYFKKLLQLIVCWRLSKNDAVLATRGVHYVASYQVDKDNTKKYQWNRLGRIYDHGVIQNLHKHLRQKLVFFNDDVVNSVELDYKAMQPSILYVLMTNDKNSVIERDFYLLPSDPNIERDLAKYATLILLNAMSMKAAVMAVRNFMVFNLNVPKSDKRLTNKYIKYVFDTILKDNPFLKGLEFTGIGKVIQNIDGQIATRVLYKMVVQNDVPTFAIHDSFVTINLFENMLKQCMEEVWVNVLVNFIKDKNKRKLFKFYRKLPPAAEDKKYRYTVDTGRPPLPLPIIC